MSDINELQAEIVRLTVDRDNWRNQAQTELRELSAAQAELVALRAELARMEEYLRNSGRNMDEAQEQIAERDANLTNLRARVAELEKQNGLLICDRARFPDKSCEVGNIIAAHIENLKSTSESNAEAWRWACVRENALKERNAELEAALRGVLKNAERDGDTRLAVQKALSVLASHAAGEPAKHPDTVTEEGLTGIKFRDAKSEREVMLITEGEWRDWIACKRPDGLWVSMRVATEQDRAAIDAARKDGGDLA